jgi:hypothetical protein
MACTAHKLQQHFAYIGEWETVPRIVNFSITATIGVLKMLSIDCNGIY